MEESGESQLLSWPISTNLLEKRRSCELTRKVTPCIEKAVTHLYHLEDKLLNTVKNYSEKDTTDLSSTDEAQNWILTTAPDSGRQRHVISASGAQLEITGTGLIASNNQAESSLVDFGERIIKDTLLLIGRLETDRVNTQQMLVKEKRRVALLKAKITEYTHRRMHFMPIAVQKEHELCAINIQELNWHIAYKGRAKDRITEKFNYAETVNKALKEDISYIKRQKPWIEAKLKEERAQMEDIKMQQNSTDAELAGALALLNSMEEKFTRAEQKAERAREALQKEVDEIRQQLNKHTEELSKYKMHYTSYVHSINDARDRLREMDEESLVLVARHGKALEMRNFNEEKLDILKGKVNEQAAEKAKLLEENSKLKSEKDEQKSVLESENAILDLEVKKQTKELRVMVSKNRAFDRDIRGFRRSIKDTAKDKLDSEKIAKRAEMEIARIEAEAELLREEHAKVSLVHEKLQTTLDREREKCGKIEDDLTTTADSLKKQLRDEAHARTVLQARFAADTADLVKRKIDAALKREKSTKRAQDIEKAVGNVKKQVEKMEKANAEREKVMSELDALLEKVRLHQEETERAGKSKIDELIPKEKGAKEEIQSLDRRLEEMEWRTEMIEKRMHDMASSSVMMNRVLLSTQEAIEELSDEQNELEIQLHAGQGISETLESTLTQLKERGCKSAREHSQHMENRDKKLQLSEDEMQKALDENTQLAKEYTSTQGQLMTLKDTLLRTYEVSILRQNSLKDRKELFDFRTRLHKALESYYKLRGAQTRAGILQFERMVDKNGQRLTEIEGSLIETLDHITEFLSVNNASHKSIRLQADQLSNGAIGVSA